MAQHPREHVVRQQADVVGEHAEDEPVDEVRDRLRIVAAPAQCLRDRRERGRRALGERLPGLSRPQPNRIRERPLEPVARRRVGQVVELELVRLADAVRPVGADPEPHHVGDDQERRVLERQRVLPQLLEGGVEVGAPSLVLPGEVVALPDVRPAVAARVLARAPLEAVRRAGRVGLDRRRLAQQPAQVDEVLLRGRALLQLGGPPLGDELVRRHAAALARGCRDRIQAGVIPLLGPGDGAPAPCRTTPVGASRTLRCSTRHAPTPAPSRARSRCDLVIHGRLFRAVTSGLSRS